MGGLGIIGGHWVGVVVFGKWLDIWGLAWFRVLGVHVYGRRLSDVLRANSLWCGGSCV